MTNPRGTGVANSMSQRLWGDICLVFGALVDKDTVGDDGRGVGANVLSYGLWCNAQLFLGNWQLGVE